MQQRLAKHCYTLILKPCHTQNLKSRSTALMAAEVVSLQFKQIPAVLIKNKVMIKILAAILGNLLMKHT